MKILLVIVLCVIKLIIQLDLCRNISLHPSFLQVGSVNGGTSLGLLELVVVSAVYCGAVLGTWRGALDKNKLMVVAVA